MVVYAIWLGNSPFKTVDRVRCPTRLLGFGGVILDVWDVQLTTDPHRHIVLCLEGVNSLDKSLFIL